jgi:hypothetical protein
MTMTERITFDQMKQFNRFVEDAVNRALKDLNPDKDGLQRLIERGGDFQAYVVTGLARFTSRLPDYTLARKVLGADFISADEIATARGIAYTEDQLIELGKKIPDQTTLETIRDNGMILVAGPPTAMTMLDVRAIHANFFYHKGPKRDDSGWYDEASEKFAYTDKVEALCWIAFSKEPVKDSFRRTWSGQQELTAEPMIIPNVAEATWPLTTYKAVRNVYLLDELYVRTSSFDSDGHSVGVGDFNDKGLGIGYCGNDDRDVSLGLSYGMKF